jgi:hypothetical protein
MDNPRDYRDRQVTVDILLSARDDMRLRLETYGEAPLTDLTELARLEGEARRAFAGDPEMLAATIASVFLEQLSEIEAYRAAQPARVSESQ